MRSGIYEQWSIRRTYELDVMLEAIVPKDTGWASTVQWAWCGNGYLK